MTHYSTTIDTFVAGIPCQLGVVEFTIDYDESGSFIECDYHVLDRRGRKAPWLARKITPSMHAAILEEIEHYVTAEFNEYFGD
jgi:hypothetical protein